MNALQEAFKKVEDHSEEGKAAAKTIHILYANSVRGDVISLSVLKSYKYEGIDERLKVKVTDLVLLASSSGATQ